MREVTESSNRHDTPATSGERPNPHWLWWLFSATVLCLVVFAGRQLVARIRFPWDLFIWAESPFLTNLLKLDRGQPIYGPPSEANSFIYSPGLEYLTYLILKPFGRQLDIRYCRLVSVGFAVLASIVLARCSKVLSDTLFPGDRNRAFTLVASGLFFLVIYQNFTSDVPHPDNLHIAHSAVALLLTLLAVRRESFRLAVWAVLFAGVGVYVKQVAGLTPIGVALALAFGLRKGLKPGLALLGVGGAATLGFLALLWLPEWSKFYTYDVPAKHGVILLKIPLLRIFLFQENHRLLPIVLFPAALGAMVVSRSGMALRLIAAFGIAATFALAPVFLAFIKPMGAWNNLGIVSAWIMVPIVPWLFACLRELRLGMNAAPDDRFARLAIVVVAFAWVLTLLPAKTKPTSTHYRYCWNLQSQVGADLKAGKRVLVPHGAMFLIRNHDLSIPLDRANSCLELMVAGKLNLTGTKQRIEAGYYDKIYCDVESTWYGPKIQEAIDRDYQVVGRIAGAPPQDWGQGYQYNLMRDTLVVERPPSLARAAISAPAASPVARSKVVR